MTLRSNINYLGFDFDFEYNYYPGSAGTWDEPAEFPEWEIFNITLNGIDASDLLESMILDFEEQVINQLKEY
jgi:hypothetical protein